MQSKLTGYRQDVILFVHTQTGDRFWGMFTSTTRKSARLEFRKTDTCTVCHVVDVAEDAYLPMKYHNKYLRLSDVPGMATLYKGLLDNSCVDTY